MCTGLSESKNCSMSRKIDAHDSPSQAAVSSSRARFSAARSAELPAMAVSQKPAFLASHSAIPPLLALDQLRRTMAMSATMRSPPVGLGSATMSGIIAWLGKTRFASHSFRMVAISPHACSGISAKSLGLI